MPQFWEDSRKAQVLMRERQALKTAFETIENLENELSELLELANLASLDDDRELLDQLDDALIMLTEKAERAKMRTLLSGEADGQNCFVEIHPGAGGTEAQDWAEMLYRMYVRWAAQHGYKVDILEEQAGDEAGLKSVSFKIRGDMAYGWLKTESGVHRLVRISPFDSNARRHTSFASVWVYPQVDETIDIDINESDCRIDTFRASGAGGQHVNKTDSAVRITHMPSGVVVQCQNDRSQHKNRAQAWDMLRSRLYELELQRRETEAQAKADAKADIGWGHQIRSYVMQPYQLVKDLRTQVEISDTQAVLDGDLDRFIIAALSNKYEPA